MCHDSPWPHTAYICLEALAVKRMRPCVCVLCGERKLNKLREFHSEPYFMAMEPLSFLEDDRVSEIFMIGSNLYFLCGWWSKIIIKFNFQLKVVWGEVRQWKRNSWREETGKDGETFWSWCQKLCDPCESFCVLCLKKIIYATRGKKVIPRHELDPAHKLWWSSNTSVVCQEQQPQRPEQPRSVIWH